MVLRRADKDRRIAELEAALRWYVKHVENAEGTDFLSETNAFEADEPHRSVVRSFREHQY